MSKRYGKEFDDSSSPAKRVRIGGSSARRSSGAGIVPADGKHSSNNASSRIGNDDPWGDDFDDDAIEEMDFIASQACSQDVNASVDTRTSGDNAAKAETSDASRAPTVSSTGEYRRKQRSTNSKLARIEERQGTSSAKNDDRSNARDCGRIQSQKLSSSDNIAEIREDRIPMIFDDFATNLLDRRHLNSTFQPKNDVIHASDTNESVLRRLEKLEQENKKLMDDFMTKEGETVFLRSQLQQTQLRAENERLEKDRFIEEQASRGRSELNALHKEKEVLKTQNEFQTLQLGKLMERCKLLESGAVKLTQPQRPVASSSDSPNRTRFGNLSRSASAVKSVKVSEMSVQTIDNRGRSNIILKTCIQDHPLDRLPRSIFEPSLPEKSVVDIQMIEKIGRKNLPILQEEDTFRIFENPVLVKPIVTIVDGGQLNVEFFLPDVATMMKKTRAEINSADCIPMVNKIIATTRELLLNSKIVLETILTAMKNDDVRDMNDLYFSDFYDETVDYDKTVCDSNVWYEKERGIEARRAMGVLSYVAEVSDYLCEYIAGKTRLNVEEDKKYADYTEQMIRYRAWDKRDGNFEILEMMLEFFTALGLVRRSHQFSGLICAIARTLCSVQRHVGFCDRGLTYVTNIFKEMVFSRPLLRCFLSMTEIMETFCKSERFAKRLCFNHQNVKIWNGVLHFTQDACPLEIYMMQIERFRLDPITTINMSDAFLTTVNLVILTESISWITESPNSCNCCLRVLSYAITLLGKCSRIVVEKLEKRVRRRGELAKLDENFWQRLERKQIVALKKGIRFLSYLAKREPDFITRVSDIEDSFHLFMQRISTFDRLTLHENEQEALSLIKLTLAPERAANVESRSQRSKRIFSIKSAFEEKSVPSLSSHRWYDVNAKGNWSEESTAMYRSILEGD